MGKLGKNFKVCQTCVYWGGERELDGLTKLVDAESSSKGKCSNTTGFYNQQTGAMTSCRSYTPIF